ncbi:MAG: site-2 protease family protein [Bdellovibrionales bacterium]
MISIEFIYKIFLFYLPLLFSLCVHEWAHGWMAQKRGDLTAYYHGRLTLNPLAHMDFIGTFFLPLFFLAFSSPLFFGWAKPVPVDESNLKDPKRDLFWIALAGPLSNFILAFVGAFFMSFFYIAQLKGIELKASFFQVGEVFIFMNLLLGFFNLIPLHPLDGGKVLARFLPNSWNHFLENQKYYMSFLLIFLVISGAFHYISKPLLVIAAAMIKMSQVFAIFVINIL